MFACIRNPVVWVVGWALCSAPAAAADDATGRWRFDRAHLADGLVRPIEGSLAGQVVGQPAFGDPPPGSIVLNGRDQRVTLSDDTGRLDLPRRHLTVETWARVDKPLTWGGLVTCLQDNGSYERGWLLGFRDRRFCFAVSSEGTRQLTYLTAGQDFSPGAWYHIVGTYDGESLRLFVDGQPVASSKDQSGDIVYPPKTWLEIGAYHDDNELYSLDGQIAEVSLLDRALTPADVRQRFELQQDRFPEMKPASAAQVVGWPTYMRDNRRSGLTDEILATPLACAWSYRARHKPQPAWPPPAQQDFWHNKYGLNARVTYDRAMHLVSDGERVLFGSSADDQLRCLDLATGAERWTFFAEGPVRLAPTLHQGHVYFGSDDGSVYCLDAQDGSLRWRHRVSEADRWIAGNGRIVSSWPVRSGVLIDGDRVRFAAGLFPGQGTFQLVVDAESGRRLAADRIDFSPQGYIRQEGGSVMMATGRTPAAQLDRLQRPGKVAATPLGQPPADDPFAWVGAGDLRFAGGDRRVAILHAQDGTVVQTLDVEGKAYALAVAGGALLVSTDEGTIYCFRPAEDSGTRDAAQTGSEQHAGSVRMGEPSDYWPEAHLARCYAAADRIRAETNCKSGYCLVYGAETGCLVYALARSGQRKVVGIEPDAEKAHRAQVALDALGVYGRAAIHHGSLDHTPYASCIFNLVASETAFGSAELPGRAAEVARLLRPGGGVALIGSEAAGAEPPPTAAAQLTSWAAGDDAWRMPEQGAFRAKYVRPPLAGAGQWTHLYAEPGNTACGNDTLVSGPFLVQWFGEPGPRDMIDRHHRTVSPLCSNGRLFIPGNDRMIAVDAYNGSVLWNREIPRFRRIAAMRDSGSMAAADDRLYVAAGGECLELDGRSGEAIARRVPPPDPDGAPRDWGYVAVVGERLYGSSTRPEASRRGHSRAAITDTYYDGRPLVTSTDVFCRQRKTGQLAWTYRPERGAIANPTITIGGGRVYFCESTNPATLAEPTGRSTPATLFAAGSQLVALDAATGQEVWRHDADFGSIEHHLYLCYAGERLIAVGTQNRQGAGNSRPTVWYEISAFQAADGKPLWHQSQDNRQRAGGGHGEQDHHPTVVGTTLYVEPQAYDLATGEPIGNWAFARGGHGCGTFSACPAGLFFRAGNPCMFDLANQQKTRLTQVTRPGCWINIIPAGGLVLIPEASSGCTCNFSIQTSLALIPQSLEPKQVEVPK